jgi:hypothetical protein
MLFLVNEFPDKSLYSPHQFFQNFNLIKRKTPPFGLKKDPPTPFRGK